MSYLSQTHSPKPAAMVGVVGIHAGLGALLLFGLAAGDFIPEITSGPLPTRNIAEPPPPPPPEPVEQTEPASTSVVYTPPIPPILPPQPGLIETTPILPPISDKVDLVITPPTPTPGAGTMPKAFEPVQVSPRNNPSRWLTDSDYRSIWIRKEMFGTASFTLDVGTNGRVENCTITKSTGHAALDQATCTLVTKRARFTPASDSLGAPVQGRYSSSIRWVLPD